MKILVTICSFLDDELPYTLKSCYDQAKYKDSIEFAITLQHDNHDVNIIDDLPYSIKKCKYHYKESKGVGWARNLTQQLYNEQDFILQIDSHTRMIEEWDRILLNDIEKIGKGVLSFLPPSYLKDKKENKDILFINSDRLDYIRIPKAQSFVGDWWIDLGGYVNERHTNFNCVKVAFTSGGFVFAPGNWLKDVPCDPNTYYWGEEQSVYLRTFTNGYDIFTPSQIVAWHYSASGENKSSPHHWLVNEENIVLNLNNASYLRSEQLIKNKIEGIYGLGKKRTLEDWSILSGVDFFKHTITDIEVND